MDPPPAKRLWLHRIQKCLKVKSNSTNPRRNSRDRRTGVRAALLLTKTARPCTVVEDESSGGLTGWLRLNHYISAEAARRLDLRISALRICLQQAEAPLRHRRRTATGRTNAGTAALGLCCRRAADAMLGKKIGGVITTYSKVRI